MGYSGGLPKKTTKEGSPVGLLSRVIPGDYPSDLLRRITQECSELPRGVTQWGYPGGLPTGVR